MTETAVVTPASEPAKVKSPKKKAGAKSAAKPRTSPTHPPTAEMVNAAVKTLKERGGSSLRAIKKYISATYKVDADRMAPFIRRYLKSAVASGNLVQTKGTGATGSFKLPTGSPVGHEKKKPAAKAKAVAKKPAATKEKKSSPSKAKKVTKPPTAPKAPKPKKAATKSAAKPKKSPTKKAVRKNTPRKK